MKHPVLTATFHPPTSARNFVLAGLASSLAIFGVLRLNWMETHAVLPLTRAQAGLAFGLFGTPALPVEATLACSGADAMALCVGAVVAYPAPWRTRLAGAAGGVAMILALNTLRIGSLGRAVASPEWFNALHLYIWPALLTLAIAGYVFAWMRLMDRMPPDPSRAARPRPSRRFVILTAALVILFTAAGPLYLDGAWVLALATLIAQAGAALLGGAGVTAHAAGNVLVMPRGAFIVTQECVSTPLIPVYLAAVGAYAPTWRRAALGLLLALPLFMLLGIGRLLVVALPPAVLASPLFLVHAFYQLLLGGVIVWAAAAWYHGGRAATRHALAGLAVSAIVLYALRPIDGMVAAALVRAPLDDPQGAIAFLPAFQVALYLALCVSAFAAGWRRLAAGLTLLVLAQVGGWLALQALADSPGFMLHVRDVRALAVMIPLVIFAMLVRGARPQH